MAPISSQPPIRKGSKKNATFNGSLLRKSVLGSLAPMLAALSFRNCTLCCSLSYAASLTSHVFPAREISIVFRVGTGSGAGLGLDKGRSDPLVCFGIVRKGRLGAAAKG